jgi:hypothetical protein
VGEGLGLFNSGLTEIGVKGQAMRGEDRVTQLKRGSFARTRGGTRGGKKGERET